MIANLADRVRRAGRVVVVTGAGVSAASGIPTFRSAGGLWKNFRPEELATPQAFASHPDIVWEWYDWRRSQIAAAEPNAAHHVLARWTRERRGTTLITQNVDGLHERAGADDVIRLHGSIWELSCRAGCDGGTRRWEDHSARLEPCPPRCPSCGGLARPGVVWFGEALDQHVLTRALDAATTCDVFLTVGTSAVVYPAAGLVHEAKRQGAFTAEINPDSTGASSAVDLAIRDRAEEVLPEVDRLLAAP